MCLDAIEKKCSGWLEEVDKALPTIVVVLPPGENAADLTLTIDGAPRPGALSGRSIPLDPGPHLLRVQRGGELLHEEKVVLAEGQRLRMEPKWRKAEPPAPSSRVSTPAAAPAPPPPQPLPGDDAAISPFVWVGIATTGVGLVVGAITGGWALSNASDIDKQCPDMRCDPDQQQAIDDGTTVAHISTISFAVAGVGAALAVVGLVLSFDDTDEVAVVLSPTGLAIRGRL